MVLCLFDIDHTLVDKMTGHRAAFEAGLRQVYGPGIGLGNVMMHGNTDQRIIFEAVTAAGLSENQARQGLDRCMQVMADVFERNAGKERITVLPGVNGLLKALKERGVVLGLVTGNVERIAHVKLRSIGLDEFFPFGGFGSDHMDRAQLVRIAVRRAKKFGFKDGKVVLVGDTPKDIAAGREAGVFTVAVATGIYSVAQLNEAKADVVFKDLSDADAFLRVLTDEQSS
ncbi:MAG: HAD family hydrolase [Nanoarchaeota archaeon]